MTISSSSGIQSLARVPAEFQALLRVVQAATRRASTPLPGIDAAHLPALFATARRHRMLPLLVRYAGEACIHIAESARLQLLLEIAGGAARSLLLTSELLRVMEAFENRGVVAACYKGPVVSAWAYGELGLRPFDDLDVLVDRKDLRTASGALRELGYSLIYPSCDSDRALAVRTEYHFPYRGPRHTVVELHCRLAPYYFLEGTGAASPLSRLVRASVGIGEVPALAVEDLLLSLCFHGAKHRWHWLSLVADIALLIAATPGILWGVLWDRARAIGARRMTLLGLGLAAGLARAPVPADLISMAERDPDVQSLIDAVIGGMWSPEGRPEPAAMPAFHLRCFERKRDKLRYSVLSVLAPNWNDIEWISLPAALSGLYWFTRPARLLSQRLPYVRRMLAPE
jgi:hypothetical protein